MWIFKQIMRSGDILSIKEFVSKIAISSFHDITALKTSKSFRKKEENVYVPNRHDDIVWRLQPENVPDACEYYGLGCFLCKGISKAHSFY